MYVVKTQDGETVMITSRREDAEAFTSTKLDEDEYVIEENEDEPIYPGGCVR